MEKKKEEHVTLNGNGFALIVFVRYNVKLIWNADISSDTEFP